LQSGFPGVDRPLVGLSVIPSLRGAAWSAATAAVGRVNQMGASCTVTKLPSMPLLVSPQTLRPIYRTDIGRIGDVNDVIEPGHGRGVYVLRPAECSISAPAGGAGDIRACGLAPWLLLEKRRDCATDRRVIAVSWSAKSPSESVCREGKRDDRQA